MQFLKLKLKKLLSIYGLALPCAFNFIIRYYVSSGTLKYKETLCLIYAQTITLKGTFPSICDV